VPKASILGSSVQSRLPREQSVSAVRCLAITPPKASGGSRSEIFGVVEAGRRNLGTEKQAQVSPQETRSGLCGEPGHLSRSSHSRCSADVVSPHRTHAGPQRSPEVLDTSLQHALPTSSGQHGRPSSGLHPGSTGSAPEAPNISTVWRSVENEWRHERLERWHALRRRGRQTATSCMRRSGVSMSPMPFGLSSAR